MGAVSVAKPNDGERPLSPRVRTGLRAAAAVGVLAVAFHVVYGQLGLGGHS